MYSVQWVEWWCQTRPSTSVSPSTDSVTSWLGRQVRGSTLSSHQYNPLPSYIERQSTYLVIPDTSEVSQDRQDLWLTLVTICKVSGPPPPLPPPLLLPPTPPHQTIQPCPQEVATAAPVAPSSLAIRLYKHNPPHLDLYYLTNNIMICDSIIFR